MIDLDLTLHGTTSLDSLIETLERLDQSDTVQFDFCYLAPTTLNSYRGYYDRLALGWCNTDRQHFDGEYWPTVAALLDELHGARGQTFEGWKGGLYFMSGRTPVYVANPGQTGGTGIVAVDDEHHSVVLVTQRVD